MIGLALSILYWVGLDPVPWLADLIGTSEAGLKLLISMVIVYLLAIVYHQYIKQHTYLRNLYFIVTGLDLAFYNFGLALYHSVVPVLVMYMTTTALGPGKIHTLVTFVFNMGYLITGYLMTESEGYDITWTMPHCVLTLKLIALSFDMWDGQLMLKGQELSENSKKTALETPPALIELFGFIFFPACYLIGPIFSFRRYSDFINDKFPDDPDVYEHQALKRFIQGVIYMSAFQIGVSTYNMQYMLSDEFWQRSIFYRHYYCGLWGHFALYKYIASWLLTEASCIRFGMSYNGTVTEDGITTTKWDGCNNIKLFTFETATKFQHYIDSFNCNTNYFAAEYVYKRLKFLGDRNLSQFFTLFFLAVWHGVRSGYYVTFFNEFIIIYMEKGLESVLTRTPLYKRMWENKVSSYILYTILKTYTIVFMGWSLVPFDVKVFQKWWSIYSSLYFSGFILFLPWEFLYKRLLIKFLNIYHPKTE